MNKIRLEVDKILGRALIIIMAVSVINVLWQVFTRFILKSPSSYTEELARFLLIWIGLLGASYAVGKRMHLAIDVVLLKLKGKMRILAEMLIQTLIFLFALSVMIIGGIRLLIITFTLNQISAALQVNLGYVYLIIPLSGLLIMFYAFVFFMEKYRELMGLSINEPCEGSIQSTDK